MKRVGIIGWRGMVGSVLVERMRAEKDFALIEPHFFSTSQAGGRGPAIGKDAPPVKNAKSLEDPLVNLRCGVRIMCTLVAKDGVIASSDGGRHRGGARYWSVLRVGAGHHLDEIRTAARVAVGL